MTTDTTYRVSLIGSFMVLVSALAAQAQDQGGTTGVFSLSERLSTVTNPELSAGGSDGITSLTTGLGYSLTSRTVNESIGLDAGLGLILRDVGGSFETEVTAPNLGLSYGRSAQDSDLSVNVGYSRDQIETVRSLDDFINDDGILVLPDNPDDLVGTGTKQDMSASARLELGKTAPFGVTFAADFSKVQYFETTDPDLVDEVSSTLSATGRFTVSPLISLSLGISQTHVKADGSPADDSRDLTLRASYQVSPVLLVTAGASHSFTDGTTSPSLSGVYTLQTGQLSLNLTDDSQELVYSQTLQTGQLTARASHGPDSTGTGTVDLLGLGYNQAINDVSGLGLGLFYNHETTPGSDVAGTDLVVSYNRKVTQDWGLNMGLNYRLRDEAGVGTGNSAGLFVGISRDFSFRP